MAQSARDPSDKSVALAKVFRERLADNAERIDAFEEDIRSHKESIKELERFKKIAEQELRYHRRRTVLKQRKNPQSAESESAIPKDGKTAAWNVLTGLLFGAVSASQMIENGADGIGKWYVIIAAVSLT